MAFSFDVATLQIVHIVVISHKVVGLCYCTEVCCRMSVSRGLCTSNRVKDFLTAADGGMTRANGNIFNVSSYHLLKKQK